MRRPAPIPAEQQDTPAGELHDPLSELTRRDDLRRLVTDLGRLPEQQRSALLMRELEGLSYAELAGALGCTLPAVKSLLVRARIGLAEAHTSRDAACSEIRSDLAATYDRRVRASAHARRHMRDCADCRSFRAAMQGSSREMDALTPSSGPLVWLAKLLGVGGSGAAGGGLAGGTAGGGAAGLAGGGGAAGLGGGIAGGTGMAVGSGAVAATATKVAVVVCCVAGVAGGAKKIEHRTAEAARPAASAAALVPVLPATGAARDEPRMMEPAVAEKPAPVTQPAEEPAMVPAAEEPAEQEVTGEASALSSNGGIEAPDEPAEVTVTSAEPAKDTPEPAAATTPTPDPAKGTTPSSTTGSQPTATDATTVTSSPGATAAPAAAASTPPAG